jgi:hypothetical protein
MFYWVRSYGVLLEDVEIMHEGPGRDPTRSWLVCHIEVISLEKGYELFKDDPRLGDLFSSVKQHLKART